MEVVPLTCGHCAAPLDVPAGARFATCAECGSRLAIHRTPSSVWTETLERIEKRHEESAGDLETIRLQNELAQIDREWKLERKESLITDRSGRTRAPREADAVGSSILMIPAGLGMVAILSFVLSTTSGPEAGILVVGVLIAFGSPFVRLARTVREASTCRAAEVRWPATRKELLDRIAERAGRPAAPEATQPPVSRGAKRAKGSHPAALRPPTTWLHSRGPGRARTARGRYRAPSALRAAGEVGPAARHGASDGRRVPRTDCRCGAARRCAPETVEKATGASATERPSPDTVNFDGARFAATRARL